MHHSSRRPFKPTALALLLAAGLSPAASWALDFANGPPGSVSMGLAPNVIISLDDSQSMETGLNGQLNGKPSRADLLKEAVEQTFSDTSLLPNGSIRLAWQVMNSNNLEKLPATIANPDAENAIRVLDDEQRRRFIDYVKKGYSPQQLTPTHDVMQAADEYMRAPLNINGPWASILPGTPQVKKDTYLGCRRTFHLLFTDGGWKDNSSTWSMQPDGKYRPSNPVGNYDGENHIFPDGTRYDVNDPNTRVYQDPWNVTSIADWAFYSWANPLQDPKNLIGNIKPSLEYIKAPASETFIAKKTGVKATLPQYWNPRYNPATWPHMVTYTIGFSEEAIPTKNFGRQTYGFNAYLKEELLRPAIVGSGRPAADAIGDIVRPSSLVPYGFDGDFVNYANGKYIWRARAKFSGDGPNTDPNQPPQFFDPVITGSFYSDADSRTKTYTSGEVQIDMWHTAINGRGKYFQVEAADDLKKAFSYFLAEVQTQSIIASSSGRAASGSDATRTGVSIFTSEYDPEQNWKGWISAEIFNPDGSTKPAWGGANTADKIDARSSNDRIIATWSKQPDADAKGVSFRWDQLDQEAQAFLNGVDGRGQERLDYIRGDRSKEGASPDKGFRVRSSAQGGSINSKLLYVGTPSAEFSLPSYSAFSRHLKDRLPMIYVGSDDGMLHGFSAIDGSEKIAYVPRGLIPKLKLLTEPSFNQVHQHFVDGSPMAGDVDTSNNDNLPNWSTMLVGTLGAGGKGYFVLDVTMAGQVSDANNVNNVMNSFREDWAIKLVEMDKTRAADEPVVPEAACNNDADCLDQADIGHIFDKPVLEKPGSYQATQITRLNNGRWAVVLGNGYNSANQRPVLLVQYLDGDKKLLRLVATGTTPTLASANTTDNGLSAPRLVDINIDGKPDVAYAGDMKGNMWKFLLNDSDDSKWGPARFGSRANQTSNHSTTGEPLFSTGAQQPISIAPTVRVNNRSKTVNNVRQPVGGLMVAFGTGRNITKTDPKNTDRQTLYAVLDNTRYKNKQINPNQARVEICAAFPAPSGDDCEKLITAMRDLPEAVDKRLLAQRSIDPKPINVPANKNPGQVRDARQFWKAAQSSQVDWSWQKGWYMDLPEVGERVIDPLNFYDNSNILAVYSKVPPSGVPAAAGSGAANTPTSSSVESCVNTGGTNASVSPERQFLTLINIIDGHQAQNQLMDTDGDGVYDSTKDQGAYRVAIAGGEQIMIKRGNVIVNSGGKDASGQVRSDALAAMPGFFVQPNWRQFQ